ncbi:LexA family transcriptional regulator [Pseudomonas monteilii]|uniref:LexA family transcriptional regulator n=1 Tax=Pseudomonas monteilii TaxID=76759 RepID=UPI001E3D88D6|nr:LexA family transcriptional regulator [Pseudomonas monteilii]MCE0873759.1 LexA family transcriptional regulator [Pseudomonas monteilii]MCE0925983.1 LexA family transcriptional regulator [Pseudomonas monteilii]MCE0934670.1 LexA family transcriptional regulator [Pseudomonas monteilii]MCE0980981.1 LexA family transcriptional regulator [Pseudomonas monteilii]MCE1012252.1 LexA family transcriptional regulator [Pseudomonas monteilii]
MHKSIDKILAQLMAENAISQVELSSRTCVGQSTISRILKPQGPKGIKEPTDKQVRPLADFFGITTDQLRGYEPLGEEKPEADQREVLSTADIVKQMLAKHGKGLSPDARQKIADAIEEKSAAQATTNVVTVDFSRPGQVGDEVWIAHYDVRAAMGGGQIPHDYPEMLQDIRVSPRHLREMGVTFKEHFHLKMITGWGQSMAPTIKDRDPLLVDITIREFTGDGIYLFSHDEMLYVKRLQKKGKERFKMISDNKHHDPEEIRVDDTHILARVLYVWNGQPV